MKEKYLVLNAGSSSLKFSLYEMPDSVEIINGLIEKIGEPDSSLTIKYNNKKIELKKSINNHSIAINCMMSLLIKNGIIKSLDEIKGIGHRILHGGEIYKDSVLIDNEVLNNIKSLTKLGPLHHPSEIVGIESMNNLLPNVPQIAVFDTAFHQTIPNYNYLYAVPYSWYKENQVRKYGFHGTSHKYITEKMQNYYHKDIINLIVCHIGSGASISCIKDGKCYDTSMGLTPLDGLIMGTRSGSIDCSIIDYIIKERNISVKEVIDILNKKSGLKGLTGKNDLRDLEKQINNGDISAALAVKMFEDSIVKYIAKYYFELEGKVDALVFTAGVGENSIIVREDVVKSISKVCNVELDENENNNIGRKKHKQSGKISTNKSKFDIFVIPTDEEYMILKDTYEITKKKNQKNVKRLIKD